MWPRCSRGDGLKRFHHKRRPQEKPWLRSTLLSLEPGLAAGSCIWWFHPAFSGFFSCIVLSPCCWCSIRSEKQTSPTGCQPPKPCPWALLPFPGSRMSLWMWSCSLIMFLEAHRLSLMSFFLQMLLHAFPQWVSARPQHSKESENVAVLTRKFLFLSNKACQSL